MFHMPVYLLLHGKSDFDVVPSSQSSLSSHQLSPSPQHMPEPAPSYDDSDIHAIYAGIKHYIAVFEQQLQNLYLI